MWKRIILFSMWKRIILLVIALRSQLAVVKAYSWLCTQPSLVSTLRPYGMLEIESLCHLSSPKVNRATKKCSRKGLADLKIEIKVLL